jgi:hypothetical protein
VSAHAGQIWKSPEWYCGTSCARRARPGDGYGHKLPGITWAVVRVADNEERPGDGGKIYMPHTGLFHGVDVVLSWQGRKGMRVAVRTLTLSAVDLLEHPGEIDNAKTAFEKRKAGRKWTTRITAESRPPLNDTGK